MKKSVMTLVGCALVAGVSMAASVTGNNTAVVIQKAGNATKTTNYQFLCIPVRGFDITGATESKTIRLADVLPPSEFEVGSFVKIEKQNGQQTSTTPPQYNVLNKGTSEAPNHVWTENVSETESDNVELYQTDVLWLKSSARPDIIFCGEQATVTTFTLVENDITANGNATSQAKSIPDLCTAANITPTFGDQIFVTDKNSDDYKIYQFIWGTWRKLAANGIDWINLESTDDIPAGEGFYYYDAN